MLLVVEAGLDDTFFFTSVGKKSDPRHCPTSVRFRVSTSTVYCLLIRQRVSLEGNQRAESPAKRACDGGNGVAEPALTAGGRALHGIGVLVAARLTVWER